VTRYTVQFMPAWLVFAAAALVAGWGWLRRRQAPELPGFVFTLPRLLVGGVLAAVCLLLAFGSLAF
ncbi:MAG: hypothetical protein H6649_09815, partial [Caldilineae bacterium]|nr:hypothetical protein [Caldilineae bacterium]